MTSSKRDVWRRQARFSYYPYSSIMLIIMNLTHLDAQALGGGRTPAAKGGPRIRSLFPIRCRRCLKTCIPALVRRSHFPDATQTRVQAQGFPRTRNQLHSEFTLNPAFTAQ